MRSSTWKSYLAVAGVAIALQLAMPTGTWALPLWSTLVGLAGAVTMVVGIRRFRPAGAVAWYAFAAGIALNAAGQMVEAISERIFHTDGIPSPADVFYLGLYPGLVVGCALLIRRRSATKDRSSLVDATTISAGLGLLSWVFVIRPVAADPNLGLLGHMVSVSYPIFDIVVLGMMTRLVLGGGAKTTSFRLVVSGMVCFLVTDAVWAGLNQVDSIPPTWIERALQMLGLLAYSLFGAATLHPSVREVGQRAVVSMQPRLSRPLLALLTLTSLIAPGVLALQVRDHEVKDGVAIVIGCVALFLLVVTRMSQLLRQVEAQARQLRDLSRVDELTGLPNRRGWSPALTSAIERARRDATPLAVAMVDLDHFKRFNDEYGHPAGDRLLKGAASAWAAQLRAVDELARYGGEEFIVLLPTADSKQASVVLQRMLTVTPAGQTFSAGIAVWNGKETSDELVARADRALYRAKDDGRNQIAMADGTPRAALTSTLRP
jgi:diguanylate cyclase (GGDEF)-like protein